MLREVAAMANGGLEADAVEKAIQDTCGALQKQMAALNAVDYYGQSEHKATCPSCRASHTVAPPVPNATEVARATAHTTKALDELYRLLQFAKGNPDSRPDLGDGAPHPAGRFPPSADECPPILAPAPYTLGGSMNRIFYGWLITSVTLHSVVRVRDLDTGAPAVYTLVFPVEAGAA